MRTRLTMLLAAVALSLSACDKASSPDPAPKTAPVVKLGDLSTSLEAARAAFNAHKGEARFLTLLSPT